MLRLAGRAAPAATGQEACRHAGPNYRGIRVAVLGASGFIGRWVVRKLSEAGAETYLVVRNGAGIPGNVIETDLLDSAALPVLFRRLRPSITFNLAGYGVDRSEYDEGLAYRINAELPRVICESASAVRD